MMRVERHRAPITHTTIIMVTIDDLELEDAPQHVVNEMLSARTIGDHLRALGSLADCCEAQVPFDNPNPFLGVWARAMSEVRDQLKDQVRRAVRDSMEIHTRRSRGFEEGEIIESPPSLPSPQKLIGDGKP